MQSLYLSKYEEDEIVEVFSKDRLSTYKTLAKSDNVETLLSLYCINTELSESFYTPLQTLEIVLRNKIHNQLTTAYDSHWLRKFPFQFAQRRQVEIAINSLKLQTIPKLIAELSLSFWVGLFGRHYEELWRQHLRFIFSSTTALTRKDIHSQLNSLRLLRNRIAHHEPIINRHLEADYTTILSLLTRLSPAVTKWVSHHTRVAEILEIYNKVISCS